LGDESKRHWNVSIGHAVSQDLKNWEILPDALNPSKAEGDWDDFTTWTGSIIQNEGTWYMFYTGSSQEEGGLKQRIGLAISDDLMNWSRYGENPILTPDPRWYETLEGGLWHDQAWRDPWVFQYNGVFHAFITARTNVGSKLSRGVIGYAASDDLLSWEVHPPITEPGEFCYMEVPQLFKVDQRWYLLFSATKDIFSESRLSRPGIQLQTGTHYMVADHPLGPYWYITDIFMVGDEIGSLYSGRVIQDSYHNWQFMAFRMYAAGNRFIGEITDPFRINVTPDGKLSLVMEV
jgi:beta-fructofuranosidase